MLNDYKLVIFDWDGTLMDSVGYIVKCIQFAANANQLLPPDEQSIRNIIGMSLPNAFETLFSLDFNDKYETFKSVYKDHYHQGQEDALPLFDGVEELLNNLSASGKKLAVATGKGRPGLEKAMQRTQLNQLFEYSRTSDEAQSKPSPDMLHQILDYFQLAPSEAVMIGDSIHDLHMAEQAGMDRIGVSFGAHCRDKLMTHTPIAVIDSYDEILQTL